MKAINLKDFIRTKVHTDTLVKPAEALKILRELQYLSQNKLSEITGISQSNISALENGARQMGRDRALVLASALHVHPAVLLFPDFDINEVA